LAAGLAVVWVSLAAAPDAGSSSTVSLIVEKAAMPCSGALFSGVWGLRRMRALEVFFWRRE
jgi:hypothetical protein